MHRACFNLRHLGDFGKSRDLVYNLFLYQGIFFMLKEEQMFSDLDPTLHS